MGDWLFLAGAIGFEIAATSALKAAAGFTRAVPSAIVITGYVAAFYCLSLALRSIPMGVAYAIWSGIGIVVILLVGGIVYASRTPSPGCDDALPPLHGKRRGRADRGACCRSVAQRG